MQPRRPIFNVMNKVKTIVVEVTQADINFGIRMSSCDCPVAMAIQRKTRMPIRVGANLITWPSCNVQHPPAVRQFITQFDRGKFVEPFSFDLEIPAAEAEAVAEAGAC